MDPITTILMAGGTTILKKALEAAMTKLLKRKRAAVSEADKKKIEQTADRMIQVATLDDVKQYSPEYERLSAAMGHRYGAAKKAACKKRPPRKAPTKVMKLKRETAKKSNTKLR